MFCPKCRSLLSRKNVRGRPTAYCPACDGKGSDTQPLAWFTKDGGGPDRASGAAQVAARARPHVQASDKRAKPAEGQRRGPKELPPPQRLKIDPGMDLFPFDNVREGQRQFIADVEQVAREGKHLLAHAPTGLGKTVSTLAPLVHYALANDKRIFFLTSKQSQHKIAVDTLKAIREKAGVPFVVSDIIGKQDMCPRREARDLFPKRFSEFCRREQVSHQCDYWENANGGAIKALKNRVHHVEELVITATDHVVCPHQAALDLAAQAHVVVCDYNYFFSDLRQQMQERLKLDLKDVLLVVDEAHNLPDRIRDHLSLRLDDYVLDDALEEVKDLDEPALGRRIEILRLVLDQLTEDDGAGDPFGGNGRGGSERYVERKELIEAVDEALGKKAETLIATDFAGLLDHLDEAVDAYEKQFKVESRGLLQLHEFLTNWKIERRGLARILNREPSASLSYKILDPAVLAKPVFDAVHASVIMSGTLHPMEMIRAVLGLDPDRAILREYRSPFPRQNRLLMVDGSVTTGYKDRSPEMFANIGEKLAAIAVATPGNVAAFFPSYAILESVRPHVEMALGSAKELIVEERGLDKSEKEALIGQMRRGPDNALLMGVQGGSLSEGYDYADNLLKGVVVVGLPFAAPSLEVEALIGYYEKKFGKGLGRPYAYVHPTFHRVLQAVGRCIRGPEDRGVLILMDKRFGWGSYRASYPRDFEPRPSNDPVADVRRFWNAR